MLFWKLFFFADVLILVGYLAALWRGEEKVGWLDALAIPITLLGAVGVATYAFGFPVLPATFWRLFLPIFIAIGAWEISATTVRKGRDVGTLIGATLAAMLVGLTSVAIYRLGGSNWIGALGL